MIINIKDYKEKVLGCYMGKNIGGTLGAPFEWRRQLNEVSFYTHKLNGEPIPNDDLDIQLLWLIAMERQGINLSAIDLAHYWSVFLTPHWAEYGVAKTNMKMGVMPPLTGLLNNEYKDSCGSYIRSEIWACLAPGSPYTAAQMMLKDSCLDHGVFSEGTYAAIFITAMQSAAFLEYDILKLLDIGLSFIPTDCEISKVAKASKEYYKSGKTWKECRDMILRDFRGHPFVSLGNGVQPQKLVSQDDVKKGFDNGRKGFDAPSNIGIIILSLLYGEGDFEKSLLISVNCGEDTDCTAATIGALFGIINGISGIPKKWIEPLGYGIKTCCLNYGELGGVDGILPKTIYELTDRCANLAFDVQRKYKYNNLFVDENKPSDYSNIDLMSTSYMMEKLYEYGDGVVFSFSFFDIVVQYTDYGKVDSEGKARIKLIIVNNYDISENLILQWFCPNDVKVSQFEKASVFIPQCRYGNCKKEIEFTFDCSGFQSAKIQCLFSARIEGRCENMTIPVLFIKEMA